MYNGTSSSTGFEDGLTGISMINFHDNLNGFSALAHQLL